jgi:diguanylate cyclase (GGDEF)-like protein/PAS domain S-box-containing protein
LFDAGEDWIKRQSVGKLFPSLGTIDKSLRSIAGTIDDASADHSPVLVQGFCADGSAFHAEVSVSKLYDGIRETFVLAIRDITERFEHVRALAESEARYRALVENSPEAILVLDVDLGCFVDSNDNACRLFGRSKEELLVAGPAAISPLYQFDGSPSFGLQRGYLDRALNGGRPVFEWLHCDAAGREVPCEVRFIKLPSSERRLIRASIIDIADRRRAEALAYGERKILEMIADNGALDRTLMAVTALAEQLDSRSCAAVMLVDDSGSALELVASSGLPISLKNALSRVRIGLFGGPSANAVSLERQVVVTDMSVDPGCRDLHRVVADCDFCACLSTPIETADGKIKGTLDFYSAKGTYPTTDELDLAARLAQLAEIGVRRQQDESALRASEARFRSLFDNVVDGVFQAGPNERLMSANPALIAMLGYEDFSDLANSRIGDFCVDSNDRRLNEELAQHGRVRNYEYSLRRCNGDVLFVVESSRAVRGENGRVQYIEGTITNVTQRKVAERALFKEKERAQVTLQSIGDAVVTTDEYGAVDYLNPAAEELTGWERRAARGQRIDAVVKFGAESEQGAMENPVLRCLDEGRVMSLTEHAVLITRSGATVAIQATAAPIQDRGGNVVGAVIVFHDVSRERQVHRKLSYYATHDALTGLINRREFEERVSATLHAVHNGSCQQASLLFMDLDQFKVVNDTCGHAAGDLLLRQLADLIQTKVRIVDVVARLGGDEFAILLENCTVTRAAEVADQLREAVAEYRFSWRDRSMRVGASIGIVPVTQGSESLSALLSAADVACYVAKDLGRNRVHVYEDGDASERHKEMQWIARINTAREENRFEIYFQPIVPIRPKLNVLRQFELLLRMRDENGDLVSPSAFIPAAERYNSMASIDRWVVEETVQKLAYRGQPNVEPYMLAVNLSGTTLNDAKFLDFVLGLLKDAALPHNSLCFEITETAAIANLASVVYFMRALKDCGCLFSLDDFGTGLSSLTYLKHLPVDYIKIDGQFIRNVIRDKTDESMVHAIARMAKALEVETIAERVESRAIMGRLGNLGIDYAQGYFIAVPRPIEELPLHSAVAGRIIRSA